MIPAEVRAIFFDAVGTLLFPEPSAAAAYFQIGTRHGSRLAQDTIRERFASTFAREEAIDLSESLRTSEEREERRWRNIVAAVLDDVADPEACFRELYDHFARPTAWRLDPSAGELLRRLRDMGFCLGMASNLDHRLRRIAAGFPELQPLTRLIISSEVGWRKPAPEFFAALCRSVELPAGQILLIGDDPVNDLQGATVAGLHAFVPRDGCAELLNHLHAPR